MIQIFAYTVMVFPLTENLWVKSPPLFSAMMGVRRKKKHGEAMLAGGERWLVMRCWRVE